MKDIRYRAVNLKSNIQRNSIFRNFFSDFDSLAFNVVYLTTRLVVTQNIMETHSGNQIYFVQEQRLPEIFRKLKFTLN